MPSLMEFQIMRYFHNADNRKHKNAIGDKMGFEKKFNYVPSGINICVLCSALSTLQK